MTDDNKEYLKIIKRESPKTKHISTLFRAFFVGGAFCCIAEGLKMLYAAVTPLPEKDVAALVTVTIIFVTSILTGIGIYDRIGDFAGAGSIVPITGFANSVVSASLEKKREGVIFGVCSNMFIIAGPVLVIGIFSSVVVGLLTHIFF
jgi:stage V sporulation protein AC